MRSGADTGGSQRSATAPAAMDLATVLGLGLGFALVGAAMVLGGSPRAFVDGPSILIVLGGTLAVTTVSFSVEEILNAHRDLADTLFRRLPDSTAVAGRMIRIAERARKDGRLALQALLPTLAREPFLRKSLQLVIDGLPGDEIERVLARDAASTAQRHARTAEVLRKSAEVAPAMGLIGTLIGLVQMLGSLDDPASIGPSMALALLTTFYGAVLSNMVFAPLAGKLERNSEEETLLNGIYLLAAASIGRQENPRRLEMLINAQLPPAKRVQVFD